MHPARWHRVEELFELAMTAPRDDRRALLDRTCADDPALVADVLSLIDSASQHPDFLEQPLIDGSAIPALPSGIGPGDVLRASAGDYRVMARIGEGGMAEVYRGVRADNPDAEPVAIKVMRRGIDTEAMLKRFRLEQRILAALSHPNIAPLRDAGATPDGRPFVVLHYVDGVSLVTWCDQRRLSVDARLRLLLPVCEAVQHAHQQFVVHRDIKPSNVLVTNDGTPMLLDFGISKVLDHATGLGSQITTTLGERLLTPEYAAPEQLRGGAVSTATDVYALGLLVCEVLTGALPWSPRTPDSDGRERLHRTEPPRRPSEVITAATAMLRGTGVRELARQLDGDLDTIILSAIREEPERRYPTAAALADDLQRYLDRRPVLARTDSVGYRLRKFVRRNAIAVSAASVTGLALVVSMIVVVRNERAVARAAHRVTIERDRAREVRTFLLETFGASGADRTVGDTVSVRRLLDLQTAQAAERYGARPELHADMLEALAEAYDRLGLASTAEPLAARAVALRRAAIPTADGTLPDALAGAVSLHGWLLHASGRSREAEPLLVEAIAARRRDPDAVLGLARSLNDLGVVYNAMARYDDAMRVLQEALTLRERSLGADDRAVGITANNLAAAYFFAGRYAEAAVMQSRALKAITAAFGLDHQRTTVALANLATFRRQAGDRAGAERDYRELLARQTRLQGANHPVTARVMTSLAQVRLDAVSPSDSSPLREAEALVRRALLAFTQSLGPSHPDVGKARHQLATMLLSRGAVADAEAEERAAVSVLTASVGPWNPATLAARIGQARIVRARGDPTAALAAISALGAELHAAPDTIPGIRLERARALLARCEVSLAIELRLPRRDVLARCEQAVDALRETPTAPPALRQSALAYRDSAMKRGDEIR